METRTAILDNYMKNERGEENTEGKLWLQMFRVNSYKLCNSGLGQFNCS